MRTLSELDDKELALAIDERWRDADTLWAKMKQWSDHNRQYWRNEWEDPNKAARKTSRVKDNRIFLSIEHDVNILTSRPAKPMVMPAKSEDEGSRKVAEGLQHIFLELYRKRQVKKKLKKGIRNLHFDRLIVLYPFWNTEINDVDVRRVSPLKVRIPKNANNEDEAEWICEEIEEPIMTTLKKMPEIEEALKRLKGWDDNHITKQNPKVIYKMFWTAELVAFKFDQTILKKIKNPTWDWEGLVMEPTELQALEQLSGIARRPALARVKEEQDSRFIEEANPETGEMEQKRKEASFFYNHFDKPRKPYIFGTIFEDEEGPLGSTDLIHQGASLQDNVNRRKRQIDDNAEDANGIFVFDSKTFSKEDVQRFSARSGSRLYGANIINGFKRDAAPPLPDYVFSDMEHSIREIDNLFATQGIVRGEKEGRETASGRAMLREASMERRDETIDLIDYVTWELYNWWFQLMKLNYTEVHYVKPLGFKIAGQTIELMQDDLEDGIDIKIIPGQIVPDDKIYRQERAKEEVIAGLISPLDYYRETGRDNPDELYKRLVMFKINPMSLMEMSPEEMASLQQGQTKTKEQIGQSDEMDQIKQTLESPEFQKLPPEQQQQVIGRVRERVNQIKSA